MSHDNGGREASAGGAEPAGDIGCEEALARVYEYLDGELEPETRERIHRHLEVCRRCYPFFDFERHFLDYVREKGLSAGDTEELRERMETLLEEVE